MKEWNETDELAYLAGDMHGEAFVDTKQKPVDMKELVDESLLVFDAIAKEAKGRPRNMAMDAGVSIRRILGE